MKFSWTTLTAILGSLLTVLSYVFPDLFDSTLNGLFEQAFALGYDFIIIVLSIIAAFKARDSEFKIENFVR